MQLLRHAALIRHARTVVDIVGWSCRCSYKHSGTLPQSLPYRCCLNEFKHTMHCLCNCIVCVCICCGMISVVESNVASLGAGRHVPECCYCHNSCCWCCRMVLCWLLTLAPPLAALWPTRTVRRSTTSPPTSTAVGLAQQQTQRTSQVCTRRPPPCPLLLLLLLQEYPCIA